MSKIIIEKLTQLHGQILGSEMSIPFQHFEILMAGDACHLHYIQPLFKKTAGRFMFCEQKGVAY